MIVWSGWGLMVVVIAVIGVIVGSSASEALGQTFGVAYGPAQSVGMIIGGLLAASGIFLFAKWRESGEGRVFIDEATGQRVDVRPSAGSLFFIPTRFWTWIVLAIAVLLAFSEWSMTGPVSPSAI